MHEHTGANIHKGHMLQCASLSLCIQDIFWKNPEHSWTELPFNFKSHVGEVDAQSVFLEGVERHAGKMAVQSEVAKQLHVPMHVRPEISIKAQCDWEVKTEQLNGKQFGVCVCVYWGGLHGLLLWPETTFIPAASTAALYTSHLQRLASIVETCTIFNWPNKHCGQQREESGLSVCTTSLPLFCLLFIALVCYTLMIWHTLIFVKSVWLWCLSLIRCVGARMLLHKCFLPFMNFYHHIL